MWRRIVLSLSLLVSIVVLLPFAISTAHNLRSQLAARSQRFHHHSRAWWRHHRALLRRRQALLARRRALMAASNNGARSAGPRLSDNHSVSALALAEVPSRSGDLAMPLPNGWIVGPNVNGVETFRVAPTAGVPEAHASLAVVALASTNTNPPLSREQRNSLGGVSFTDLRRNV